MYTPSLGLVILQSQISCISFKFKTLNFITVIRSIIVLGYTNTKLAFPNTHTLSLSSNFEQTKTPTLLSLKQINITSNTNWFWWTLKIVSLYTSITNGWWIFNDQLLPFLVGGKKKNFFFPFLYGLHRLQSTAHILFWFNEYPNKIWGSIHDISLLSSKFEIQCHIKDFKFLKATIHTENWYDEFLDVSPR